jgi:hypothetical protein
MMAGSPLCGSSIEARHSLGPIFEPHALVLFDFFSFDQAPDIIVVSLLLLQIHIRSLGVSGIHLSSATI